MYIPAHRGRLSRRSFVGGLTALGRVGRRAGGAGRVRHPSPRALAGSDVQNRVSRHCAGYRRARPFRRTHSSVQTWAPRQPLGVVNSTPATVVAKERAGGIPIVFAGTSGDPVALGLVSSLSRPGGTVTGITGFGPETSVKRLEIISRVVPQRDAGPVRMAVLAETDNPATSLVLAETLAATKSIGIPVRQVELSTPFDPAAAFADVVTCTRMPWFSCPSPEMSR
jgi:hypothetical protein